MKVISFVQDEYRYDANISGILNKQNKALILKRIKTKTIVINVF